MYITVPLHKYIDCVPNQLVQLKLNFYLYLLYYIYFADIAAVSVDQCRRRYEETKNPPNIDKTQRYHKRMRPEPLSVSTRQKYM